MEKRTEEKDIIPASKGASGARIIVWKWRGQEESDSFLGVLMQQMIGHKYTKLGLRIEESTGITFEGRQREGKERRSGGEETDELSWYRNRGEKRIGGGYLLLEREINDTKVS